MNASSYTEGTVLSVNGMIRSGSFLWFHEDGAAVITGVTGLSGHITEHRAATAPAGSL